ncbi:hypothetical protein LSTR_LSTR006375 [Laodelphax striatellus]|uniref:Uncharacterized protein n=1 Tax=Laodelphax striatellus TaxID=195883 RepID=A0A482XD81_LAOST|nr:hypothetical protein LSTR_LSTR006375 [Laodelphax striatellus]
MTSTTKDRLENGVGEEYDGVLNIDVFNQGIKETLLNNISCCGDEIKRSSIPSSRIKLEYFNIDRNEKSVSKCRGKYTAPLKNTNFEFSNINENYKEIGQTITKQSPNKSEKIGFRKPIRIDQSKNTLQFYSNFMSNENIEAREKKTASVEVESKLYDSNETNKKALESENIVEKYPNFTVKKPNYLQLIGNHAYLNKFDREKKVEVNYCRDVHFFEIRNLSGNTKERCKENASNHQIENVKTSSKSERLRIPVPDVSLNNLEKTSENTIRYVGKPFHTRKLPKNIRMNDEKCNNMRGDGNNCLHCQEYFQVMDCINSKQDEEKSSNEQNTSYQIKRHMINDSSNTSGSDVSKSFEPSKNQELNGLELEKSRMAGKRGEGDYNLASDTNDLCVKILLPLEKSVYNSAKARAIKCSRSSKLQKQLTEKLENSPKKQQLYYNFLLPENNFIEKCFGGKSQLATSQINQPPIIENEQPRYTNTYRQTNNHLLPNTNQNFSPESTTRVEFMSVRKKKSQNRNSKSRNFHLSEQERRKVYPGNIIKMREDETPCEYLNQFSSILIDNLKDPIPKDPLNLPSACNVYVHKRKHPIPLERYAEHNISTTGTGSSNVTDTTTTTTTTLTETSDSNSQSVTTSKSIIILKKISELTKMSGDKNENMKCSNEKPMDKRKNNKRLHRPSNQSFAERPCCCFIQ